jgi:hypothetical protein
LVQIVYTLPGHGLWIYGDPSRCIMQVDHHIMPNDHLSQDLTVWCFYFPRSVIQSLLGFHVIIWLF